MYNTLETIFNNSHYGLGDYKEYMNNYQKFSVWMLGIMNEYKNDVNHIRSDLSEKQTILFNLLLELGSYDPPYVYYTLERILKYKPEITDTAEEDLIFLTSNGLIKIGIPNQEFDINKSVQKKVIKNIGYAIQDPIMNIYHYYKESTVLPAWLKGMIIDKSKVILNHYEQELIQKIPSSAYIMSPKSRKLTHVRDKWFWVTSEQKGGATDGLEQIMYILADQEQKAANQLLQRNLLMIHSHHYGMPIYIPNSDYYG